MDAIKNINIVFHICIYHSYSNHNNLEVACCFFCYNKCLIAVTKFYGFLNYSSSSESAVLCRTIFTRLKQLYTIYDIIYAYHKNLYIFEIDIYIKKKTIYQHVDDS